MTDRPKRKEIPLKVKRVVGARQNWVCECGCGDPVTLIVRMGTEWDHMPALALREINSDGSDYIPPQHDPDHIVARCRASHRAKTSHPRGPHTSLGSDIHNIAKAKRLADPKPSKRPMKSGNANWPQGRKLQSRPFSKAADRSHGPSCRQIHQPD